MDELTNKYNLFKKAQIIQNNYLNFNKKGKLALKCSNCEKMVTINGCTSHYNLCNNIYDDKYKFIIDYFSGYTNSVISGNEIKLDHSRRLDQWFIVVSNLNEWRKLNQYIYTYENYYKVCPICEKGFISKVSNHCSTSCSLKNHYKYYHNTPNEIERCLKISETRKKLHIVAEPWNKGMTGETYLNHYEKEDGTNSLLESLKNNNKWFLKTSIEEKMENLLKKLKIEYKYGYFYCGTQLDFKTIINNKIVFVETDGDYWHKSSRRCKDVEEINMKRLEDKLKDNYIMNLKDCYIIRFWEYNINNNIDIIENFINILKLSNDFNFNFVINDIKRYYTDNS